jgi:hypothetical protein
MRIVPRLFIIVLGTVGSSFAQDKFSPFRVHLFDASSHLRDGVSSRFDAWTTPGILEDSITKRILWKPFDPATLVVQAGATLGAEALLIGATFAPANAISSDDWLGRVGVYALGVGLGAAVLPASVYYLGKWMGGNGTESAIYWGIAGGVLVTLPQALAGNSSTEYILAFGSVAAVVGAIVGYHLSSSTVYIDETVKKPLTLQLFQKPEAQLLPLTSQGHSLLNVRFIVVSVKL